MKKKILMIFVAVMALAMLATPLVGAAQARRIKEPYYATYGVSPVSPNTVDKTVGVCTIRSGGVMQGPYTGPLGIGTMTAELIIAHENMVTGDRLVNFKNTLEITSGPYGAFTLEGLTHFKFEGGVWVSGKTVLQGMSELGPVTIIADKGFKDPPKPIWEEGVIIHP